MNDATIISDASQPDTDFGSRFPIVALTMKPSSGKRGINASNGRQPPSRSPLQQRERIRVERLPVAEERDHERQADGSFGGGNGHDEERDDLPVDVAGITAERDEREVD